MLKIDKRAYKATRDHAVKTKSLQSLLSKIEYLATYGDDDMLVELVPSFYDTIGVEWSKKNESGDYVPFMFGGLVHHDYNNEWSVNT